MGNTRSTLFAAAILPMCLPTVADPVIDVIMSLLSTHGGTQAIHRCEDSNFGGIDNIGVQDKSASDGQLKLFYNISNHCSSNGMNQAKYHGTSPITGQITLDYTWEFFHSYAFAKLGAVYVEAATETRFFEIQYAPPGVRAGSLTLNLEAGKEWGIILESGNNDNAMTNRGEFRIRLPGVPTRSPSMPPSVSPTTSVAPSVAPSSSLAPSTSLSPSSALVGYIFAGYSDCRGDIYDGMYLPHCSFYMGVKDVHECAAKCGTLSQKNHVGFTFWPSYPSCECHYVNEHSVPCNEAWVGQGCGLVANSGNKTDQHNAWSPRCFKLVDPDVDQPIVCPTSRPTQAPQAHDDDWWYDDDWWLDDDDDDDDSVYTLIPTMNPTTMSDYPSNAPSSTPSTKKPSSKGTKSMKGSKKI